MIEIIIALSIGVAIGFALNTPKQDSTEQPKDYSYYKNLSESLMQDVRRLKEELRKKKNND